MYIYIHICRCCDVITATTAVASERHPTWGDISVLLFDLSAEDLGVASALDEHDSATPASICYSDLYDNDAFSMTLFSMPKGCTLPLHSHPNMTVFTKVCAARSHAHMHILKPTDTRTHTCAGTHKHMHSRACVRPHTHTHTHTITHIHTRVRTHTHTHTHTHTLVRTRIHTHTHTHTHTLQCSATHSRSAENLGIVFFWIHSVLPVVTYINICTILGASWQSQSLNICAEVIYMYVNLWIVAIHTHIIAVIYIYQYMDKSRCFAVESTSEHSCNSRIHVLIYRHL